MRRTGLNGSPNAASTSASIPQLAPSVPPELRHILQLPETPPPAPQRLRRIVNGRRGPPGPPPPRSWISLAQSKHAPARFDTGESGAARSAPLPGAYSPGDGSLVAMTLRRMATDWEQQRDWNRYYLYTLPSRLRVALIAFISELYDPGLSIKDLRLILSGPLEQELEDYGVEKPDLATLNEDVLSIDLAGSVGKSLSLKELGDLLFPAAKMPDPETALQDSWDAPEPIMGPLQLLPNLTHLSLAVDPGQNQKASWKQLLGLCSKLTAITHLSLAGWPEPSLTPNAKFAKIISPMTGRAIQYGGTGPYSHSLDNDWTEATLMLKRLSKGFYSLEYLDLTGCADWFPALMKVLSDSNSECVDWVGDWGKITMLKLYSGYALPDDATKGEVVRFAEWVRAATDIERHIRAQRGGRGRWITVDRDVLSDRTKAMLEWEELQQAAR